MTTTNTCLENRRHVLILGSGAREHALARRLACSPSVGLVTVAPGNAGIEQPAQGLEAAIRSRPLAALTLEQTVALVLAESPDLVVVGPEDPLCIGVADAIRATGTLVFGPSMAAARLEGSKSFLKEFARRHAIPTAQCHTVTDIGEAEQIIRSHAVPMVVKANGLCGGKGVVVAATVDEALNAARAMLLDGTFGDAAREILIEDFIAGREVSIHAITDGLNWLLLPPARDHKRLRDGDDGPNTGGMGAYAPTPDVTPELMRLIEAQIVEPTIRGMREEGNPFTGVLFAGVLIDDSGQPFLLEHNVRFGDPECQVLMALLDGDLADLLHSCAVEKLDAGAVRVAHKRAALTVVLASDGYPGYPSQGLPISGIEAAEALDGVAVYHAATRLGLRGLETAGGRVLAVTATSTDIGSARELAYQAVSHIAFKGQLNRHDIGAAVC